MRASSLPLYAQVADRLREDLTRMPVGARVASEPELAEAWSVSRFTVARAMESLVNEGLLLRRQGSGTFKAAPPLRRLPGALLSFTEAVAAAGRTSSQRCLAFELMARTERMDAAPGEPLFRLERLRIVDGIVAAHHVSSIPERVVKRIGLTADRANAPDFSLYSCLDRGGLAVESADERLMARIATAAEQHLLALGDGAVVIAVERHSFAKDGSLLERVAATYDARLYSYEAHLTRSAGGPHDAFPSPETSHGSKHIDGGNGGLRLDDRPRARRARR